MKMTIDLENILDRICPLRKLEIVFHAEHQDFKIVWRNLPPDPPSGWPLQRSPDSSVIKKKNTIAQSSCVNDTLSVQLLQTKK